MISDHKNRWSSTKQAKQTGAFFWSRHNFKHLILKNLDSSSFTCPKKHRMKQTECRILFERRKSIKTLVFCDDDLWDADYIIILSDEKLGASLLWSWKCKTIKILMRSHAGVTDSLWCLRSSLWISFTLDPEVSSLVQRYMERFCGTWFRTTGSAGSKFLLIFLTILE